MKRLLFLFALLATSAQAQVSRPITQINDVTALNPYESTFTIWQGDSVRYDIYARDGSAALSLTGNVFAVWMVSARTNYGTVYLAATGTVVTATNGHVRINVTQDRTLFPPTNYWSQVRLFRVSGTSTSEVGMVAWSVMDVKESIDVAADTWLSPLDPPWTFTVNYIIAGGGVTNLGFGLTGDGIINALAVNPSVVATGSPLYEVDFTPYATGTPLYVETWTGSVGTVAGLATGSPLYEVDLTPYATGTPLYAEVYTGSVGSVAGLATGTPIYAESDPIWAGVSNATAVAINGKLGTSTWAAANSTTNYAERTIWGGAGVTFGGITRLSVEDNQLYGSWGVGELTVGTNLQVGGVVTGGLFVGDGSGLTGTAYQTSEWITNSAAAIIAAASGGSGATQLLINVSGGTQATSTIDGAVMTITDMDSPAGADLSGLSNDVLSAWATASNALAIAEAGTTLAARVAADFDGSSNAFLKAETGTWNPTNVVTLPQIHIANLGTYTVTRAVGVGSYINLTNAAQAINFGADVAATTGIFGWSLSYLGTNSLSLVVTNTGAVVQPTALSLTNGAGVILFVKPQGSQTIKAYQ